ncbi:MAG: aminoglycoside phosphotransferase family protein [Lachnospiraceae bacterium]|nr:aminoglycoside phosphotransferase family protein [Lachnospiraceae bacterium]
MNLKDKKILVTRPYKVVYQDGDRIIKVFTKEHGKANVFNEALCTARVEESGLDIPPVLEVTEIDGEWALAIQYVAGETLEEKMENDPLHIETYMEQFVDAQLSMHAKKAPRLTLQKDKFARKIASLKDKIDATTRYELNTRLQSMPNHTKLCHGDFNPSNVIVREDSSMTIVDWAHATQGNASGDAAITYLEFALRNQKKADLYLELFCKKSDTAKQYVQKWLPIAAAAQMTKGIPEEEAFLRRWTEIIDFQ